MLSGWDCGVLVQTSSERYHLHWRHRPCSNRKRLHRKRRRSTPTTLLDSARLTVFGQHQSSRQTHTSRFLMAATLSLIKTYRLGSTTMLRVCWVVHRHSHWVGMVRRWALRPGDWRSIHRAAISTISMLLLDRLHSLDWIERNYKTLNLVVSIHLHSLE